MATSAPTCVHGRQLTVCGECAPLADEAYRRTAVRETEKDVQRTVCVAGRRVVSHIGGKKPEVVRWWYHEDDASWCRCAERCVQFVIPGPPATKKNSMKLVHSKKHGGRLVPVPSDWYMDFQQRTRAAWLTRKPRDRQTLPAQLYNVQALIFLPVRFASRQYGDASGYYDAIGDALEAAGVIPNDKWIESWNGSHRYFDAENPRVELIITPLQGGAPV